MVLLRIPPITFLELALTRHGHTHTDWYDAHQISEHRRFQAIFCLSPIQCSRLFEKLCQTRGDLCPCGKVRPHHLLDVLFFLYKYPTESLQALITGADEKTLRKWNNFLIKEFTTVDWASDSFSPIPTQHPSPSVCRSTFAIDSGMTMEANVRLHLTEQILESMSNHRGIRSGAVTNSMDLQCVTNLDFASELAKWHGQTGPIPQDHGQT